MFLIRQATIDDAGTLLKLAKMVHFINLPADPDIIHGKIARSRQSFAGAAPSEREREFMFVIVDAETQNVIGTSSVICCLSWPGRPHTFLHVRERRLYSEDLRTGAVHTTLQLGTDESGPSEIGGLILSPAYRGKRERLGSFLSLVRFHFIGLNREFFANRIIAEMMAPLTPDSRNTLWEYLGRRFINLSYAEADRFCQYSKEFITALFPKEEMYVSLLPPEARNLIGKVGKETEPAKAMLEKLGFKYTGHIDPFDGGPYLEAVTDDIPLVRATRWTKLAAIEKHRPGLQPSVGMVSMMGEAIFRAVRVEYLDVDGGIAIAPDVADVLGVEVGDELGLTPLTVADMPAVREEKKISAAPTT
jgi:arginine N-succinyltransferase